MIAARARDCLLRALRCRSFRPVSSQPAHRAGLEVFFSQWALGATIQLALKRMGTDFETHICIGHNSNVLILYLSRFEWQDSWCLKRLHALTSHRDGLGALPFGRRRQSRYEEIVMGQVGNSEDR